MGTYYSLAVPEMKLISDEDAKDSGRHQSIDYGTNGVEFIAAAGRIFFVQEYLRAAGLTEVGAYTGDHHEGVSPVRGYRSLSLDEIVLLVRAQNTSTPVVLVVGEANLSGCTHADPCGSYPVSHYCGWAESTPVDKSVCAVCSHFQGGIQVQGSILKWDAVRCVHPDAYKNLLHKEE